MGVLIILVLVLVAGAPSYVIRQRRGVSNAGVAFVPLVGPLIVLLWSIGRSGWLALIGLLPFVNLVFALWLLFALPANHGRSLLWGLGLLVPLLGIYAYAFTLDTNQPFETRWLA